MIFYEGLSGIFLLTVDGCFILNAALACIIKQLFISWNFILPSDRRECPVL